ncbi:MAG: hypothetical protein J6R59_02150 [Paludibacteraceae bacterium]|nr:hypothetical protein [Paludibacteraceae bacterium]
MNKIMLSVLVLVSCLLSSCHVVWSPVIHSGCYVPHRPHRVVVHNSYHAAPVAGAVYAEPGVISAEAPIITPVIAPSCNHIHIHRKSHHHSHHKGNHKSHHNRVSRKHRK